MRRQSVVALVIRPREIEPGVRVTAKLVDETERRPRLQRRGMHRRGRGWRG